MVHPDEHTSPVNDNQGKGQDEIPSVKKVSEDLRKEIQQLKLRVDKKDPLWLKILAGLGTPLVIAVLGVIGTCQVNKFQSEGMNNRLYSEIVSKQAEGENTQRLKMFSSILETVLKSEESTGLETAESGRSGNIKDIRKRTDAKIQRIKDAVIQLELLGRNFNETIDMKPVFVSLADEINEMLCCFSDTSGRNFRRIINRDNSNDTLGLIKNRGELDSIIKLNPFKRKYYRRHRWRRRNQIKRKQARELADCKEALNKIADRIKMKQAEVLRGVGEEMRLIAPVIVNEDDYAAPDGKNILPKKCKCTLVLDGVEYPRTFLIEIKDVSRSFNTVDVAVTSAYQLPTGQVPDSLKYKLYQRSAADSESEDDSAGVVIDSCVRCELEADYYYRCEMRRDFVKQEFTLRHFDFPRVDNICLSENERCALVLNSIDSINVDISLLYFPARYAAIKDGSFYQIQALKKLKLK